MKSIDVNYLDIDPADLMKMKSDLIEIKRSIINSAEDVLWMHNSQAETICDRIDHLLSIVYKIDSDELENHYQGIWK